MWPITCYHVATTFDCMEAEFFHCRQVLSISPSHHLINPLFSISILQFDLTIGFVLLCRTNISSGEVLKQKASNVEFLSYFLGVACPALSKVPHVLVLHGEGDERVACIKRSKPKNWILHKPPWPISFGTHHSKAMFLVYPRGVRIIVHTAKIYVDWNNKSQGLWMQDFPWTEQNSLSMGSGFENDLVEYLSALKYHGGTNFGRAARGPFVATSFDYDAPLDEYALIREPKYGHLKELNKAIKAHVYSTESGDCAAFLSNYYSKSPAKVLFNNMHYSLPPWSVSILPDCRNSVFNTAKVGVQTLQMQMLPTNSHMFSRESFDEDISSLDDSYSLSTPGLLEQINVTQDASDYLWYITSVDIVHRPCCTCFHQWSTFWFYLWLGTLLSVAIGLPNVGTHYETWSTGILGPVALHGINQGKWDLSRQRWTYQVGLKGEAMNLASPNSISSVEWMQ
ncbi:beta-galactosidase [Trifolium repens]|nr:beta-galactosidase [Trifolium repens]